MVEFREIVGKKIKRVHLTNDDDFRALSIDFEDGTALRFQMERDFRAKAELLTLKGGNISAIKRLKPAPVVRRRGVPKP